MESPITARNESAHLIILDMSKAFDSINRNQLIQDLCNTIEIDELHIIFTLLNISISVRCENNLSEVFETSTGAREGDCVSAPQFIYYLAKRLEPPKFNQPADHPYAEQNVRSSISDRISEHDHCVITERSN